MRCRGSPSYMTDSKTKDQSNGETQDKLRRTDLKMNFYRNQGNKFEALAKRLAEELATAREDIQCRDETIKAMEQAKEEQEQNQQERLTETKRQLAKAREDIQALVQANEQEQIQKEQKTQADEDAAALKKKQKKIYREFTKATNNSTKNLMVLRAMAEGLRVKHPDDEVGQSKANEAWCCYETMNTFPLNLTTYPKAFADFIDLMKEGLAQTIQTVVDRTIETGKLLVATMHPDQPPMAFVEALKRYAQAKGCNSKFLFVFIWSFSISLTTKPWQPMCVTLLFVTLLFSMLVQKILASLSPSGESPCVIKNESLVPTGSSALILFFLFCWLLPRFNEFGNNERYCHSGIHVE